MDADVYPDVGYEHTQYGVWHRILLGLVALMLVGAWIAHGEMPVVVLLLATAGIFLVCAVTFGSLTIRDEGQRLALRYGPVPILRKRFRYADITSVESGRSKVIDGWGIHCIPGRGWTYNLWGFGCAKLSLGRKVVRLGSDDVDNLVEFLRTRLSAGSPDDLPPA